MQQHRPPKTPHEHLAAQARARGSAEALWMWLAPHFPGATEEAQWEAMQAGFAELGMNATIDRKHVGGQTSTFVVVRPSVEQH